MAEQEVDCDYRNTCHLGNIKQMTPANKRLKEIYCIEWPQKCAIYQAKATVKLHDYEKKGGYNPPPSNTNRPKKPTPSPPPKK